MNLKIIDVLIDFLKDNQQVIITDVDQFENKINDLAPTMMDECYLLVKAIKCGVYDMLLFNHRIEKRILVDYFIKQGEVSQQEAVFTIGVIEQVLMQFSMQMSILNFQEIKDSILEKGSLMQIKMVALAYYEGVGISQDYEQAYELFTYLFENGDYTVLGYLGYMLENGLGVEEDIIAAIDYYEQGSLNHDDHCLYHLGMCYLDGKGYVQNEDMAISYLKQSQIVDAYKALGMIYERKKLEGEAFYYYQKAAYDYDKDALYKTGMCYFDGVGVHKDIVEAKKYLTYASYLNQKDSFCKLGMMMIDGIGMEKDVDKGLEYIRKAAMLNCIDALLLLAKFYEFGQYVEKDIHRSILYYQKAIELNDDYHINMKIKRMKENEGI